MPQAITPRYKLLITYDINQGSHEAYYQFVLGELGTVMQGIGLYMVEAYHTAYGNYPQRQLEFVAEQLETIQNAMHSEQWTYVQDKFQNFTCNYTYKIVRYHPGFQF